MGLVWLSACGSGPDPKDPKTAFGGRAPTEGTIVLHQVPPKTPNFNTKQRMRPTTLRIITPALKAKQQEAREAAQDPDKAPKTPEEARRRTIQGARDNSAVILGPDRFATLWTQLETTGIFKLPQFRGGIPPEDLTSITLSAEGRTWIFLRPTDAAEGRTQKSNEEILELSSAWANSKLIIMQCTLQH